MHIREVGRIDSRLPSDDDHPYRTGAWRPNQVEYDADDLRVIQGHIPTDLAGIYLRNTENPVMEALGIYHPFDGDGMLHSIRFGDGRAHYRNRFVRTRGLLAELEAGQPLWAGIADSPARSLRDGWGARTRMKDASSTDVVVHAGRALSTFYQCGDVYQFDPNSMEQRGIAPWSAELGGWGISAHPKLDENTGELMVFAYATQPPYLRYGVLDGDGNLVHKTDIALPGPRLPHDIAFTDRHTIFNDFPLFWDPERLASGVYRPHFDPSLPSRFGILPRHGSGDEVRWFEASPTYVLHWINAYEQGDEVILDGYRQSTPIPAPDDSRGKWSRLHRQVDLWAMGTRPHRYRFNLRTGKTVEESLSEQVCEFPTIHGRHAGRAYRYVYAMTTKPGWFLFDGLLRHDVHTGEMQQYRFPEGVYGSESPMAPRIDGRAEDDGYVVTFVSDIHNDTSECQIFDARRVSDGPIARVALPERISSGTHATWAAQHDLGSRP